MIVPETITDISRREPVERPFDWDGEIHQEAMLEAFVVGVNDNRAYFVITHYDSINDYEFRERGGRDSDRYVTASLYERWSKQFPKVYRDLVHMGGVDYSTEIPEIRLVDSAPLEPDTLELIPGDFIHIHQLLLWEMPNQYGSKSGKTLLDICKLPRPNEPPENFFERTARLKSRIARQLARTIAKKENMKMNEQNRIIPNEPLRPFADLDTTFITTEWNGIKSHRFRSRNVFGNERVQDHFVDITAKPAGDYYTELGGEQNFTATGRHLFTPNVIPFGEGSAEDPLHAVTVAIYSTTVLCPAVGEQRAYITIDGRKYELLKNHEASSHYFEKPGHDVIYQGVREEGVENDTYEITPDQSEALIQRRVKELRIASTVMAEDYEDLLSGRETADLATLEARIEKRVEALRAEASETNEAIATILDHQEPIFALSSGAHLLVPRSMLDAIEVTLSGIE